jgi:hypothetical protein
MTFLIDRLSTLLARLADGGSSAYAVATADPAANYWTIEGMSSYRFSVGIFIFMMTGVIVFAAIIFRFFLSSGMGKGLKRGEKLMFLWIVLGTAVAVGFGTLQLLYGRLF